MLDYDLGKILFFDIETVPQTAVFEDLSEEMQHAWDEKFNRLQTVIPDKYAGKTSDWGFENGAGVYSEFAKIVCISVGVIYFKGRGKYIRLKSYAGDDEARILKDFGNMISHFAVTNQHFLCGHNIKEFDVPFVCRRMLINGIQIPSVLDVRGKKPWETTFLDTLEIWKFGDYKNYTSLKLLCAVFHIPTPKDDIDGSEVAGVYYKEHDVGRIATYCQKDVLATAQLFLRFLGYSLIETEHVEIIE